jgi:NitT/TauT family transport system ATP-binding protein
MAPRVLRVVTSEGVAVKQPVIEIRGVGKTYRTRDGALASLRNIDLRVDDGELVVIVGPPGCGKSTLLRLIAGLLPPTSGEIRVEGRPVTEPFGEVGIVFQNALLLPWRTVIGNIMMPVEVKRLPRAPFLQRARELLRMVSLDGFETKYPWQLSGGMRQRVSICRALIHDPRIVLMDEPFGALDALTRERMNLELQRIHRQTGKTILLITHSIPEAVLLADRVLVMTSRPGEIAASYKVELPRPRMLEVMGDPRFAALTQTIRRHFHSQTDLD